MSERESEREREGDRRERRGWGWGMVGRGWWGGEGGGGGADQIRYRLTSACLAQTDSVITELWQPGEEDRTRRRDGEMGKSGACKQRKVEESSCFQRGCDWACF